MNCEQELTALREAIRNERKNKRITQEELAEMLEVSPKQNNQTTTSNFPCNFNFAVSNMNRFNQGIYHG